MRTFTCVCGNSLFFESTQCVACGRDCGWCDGCRQVTTIESKDGALVCSNRNCKSLLARCDNWEQSNVCNCLRVIDEEAAPESGLCRSCQLTTVIPDLSVAGNLERWQALESAKRRHLYELDQLGLSFETGTGADPPLEFQFLEDTPQEQNTTGHQDGVVIINLKEAMPVEREKQRQQFGEPHRTLIGHFRHEVSHYLWMILVGGQAEEGRCVEVFGDHQSPPYGEAMPKYYEAGPPNDWQQQYISQYASSHPWEDFAETSGFYFDMCAVLDTVAWRMPEHIPTPPVYDFKRMVDDYRRLGLIFNEVNRSMGLTDLLPEVVSDTVLKKLAYVHKLYAGAQKAQGMAASTASR